MSRIHVVVVAPGGVPAVHWGTMGFYASGISNADGSIPVMSPEMQGFVWIGIGSCAVGCCKQ